MRPYSNDLRIRIIEAVERGEESWRQIARRFDVSLSCVIRLVRNYRDSGTVEPKAHGGGWKPALILDQREALRELVRAKPDATLQELRDSLGVSCSLAVISRVLKELGLPRKKKVLHAAERDTPVNKRKRSIFRKRMEAYPPKSLVFVDETSANTSMTRTHGGAPIGERVEGAVLFHWETSPLICGMRISGVTGPLVISGAVDSVAFATYVEDVLAPQLHPGDVVIWDNATLHKAVVAELAVKRTGVTLIRLPPMSADLDPIEEMFSKLKIALRSASARTRETLIEAIASALRLVLNQDIWVGSCRVLRTQCNLNAILSGSHRHRI